MYTPTTQNEFSTSCNGMHIIESLLGELKDDYRLKVLTDINNANWGYDSWQDSHR